MALAVVSVSSVEGCWLQFGGVMAAAAATVLSSVIPFIMLPVQAVGE
jgi:hypothetical protein